MDFTKKFVKAKNPCADGFRWFLKNYRDGGNYQELLDALVDEGRVNDACWLMNQFGPTDAVREVDEVDALAIVFAGTLHVRGNVNVDSLVRVGGSLIVDGGVRAGHAAPAGMEHGIVAGDEIRTGGGINAIGNVTAGGSVRAGWGVQVQGNLECASDMRVHWGLSCSGQVQIGGALHVAHELAVEGDFRCAESVQVGGEVTVQGNLRVGHGLLVGRSLYCAMHIEAGWGVKAEHDIRADGSIQAGESILAGGRLTTGEGYGVFAGLSVHADSWDTGARVVASQKPKRLMSGWWSGGSGTICTVTHSPAG